jgi:hypothetical protein
MATVYEINKGINKSVEFKGIKAQYIIYLAAGLVVLLLLFAILYACGLKLYYCIGIVVAGGAGFILFIQRCSRVYGEHGLVKQMAASRLPTSIRSQSRKVFVQLNATADAEK